MKEEKTRSRLFSPSKNSFLGLISNFEQHKGVLWSWFSHDDIMCGVAWRGIDFNFIKSKEVRIDLSESALTRQGKNRVKKLISNSKKVWVFKIEIIEEKWSVGSETHSNSLPK